MCVYHDFFLIPGSGSTFPEVDSDPVKWYGSDRKCNGSLTPKSGGIISKIYAPCEGPTTVEKFSAAKETSPPPAQDEMSLDNNNSVKVTNTIDANLNMIDPSALFVMKVKMRTGGVVASPMRDNRKDLDGFVRESEFILGSRRKVIEITVTHFFIFLWFLQRNSNSLFLNNS